MQIFNKTILSLIRPYITRHMARQQHHTLHQCIVIAVNENFKTINSVTKRDKCEK